jgi:MFS family permease
MRTRNRVLALLFLLTVVTYLDRVCIGTMAEAISRELGLTPRQMGTVFSAFLLGYVLFEIPGGWLADRYGARVLLPRIVVWWSLFTAATGWAWNFSSLVLIRFLFGAGEAGAWLAARVPAWESVPV